MRKASLFLIIFITFSAPAFAIETSPRISDKEIIEKLASLKEGQKSMNKRFEDLRSEMNNSSTGLRSDMNKSSTELRYDMNARFKDLRSDMNTRFKDLRVDINKRFDMLTWMVGLFISIAMIIMGYMLRLQWLMRENQTRMETTLSTQKDEFAFLKNLIEKLMPPKSAL